MLVSLRRKIILFSTLLVIASGFLTILSPQATFAKCPEHSGFLNFPNWYRGLECDSGRVVIPSGGKVDFGNDVVWPVILNVTDILLQVAGIVAMVLVIWNGIQYMWVRGNADGVAKAQKGIWQASVGLVVAVLASTVVGFIVGRLSGGSAGGGVPAIDAANIIRNGMNMLWWMVGIICVVLIVYSSFQYLTSRGFQDKALNARRTLLGSLIGLAITLLASLLTNVVISLVS